MSDDTQSVPGTVGLREIHLALVGQHTRYMLKAYLRHVFMVTSVLLAIALTIDLWPQFHIIANGQGHGALNAIWNVLRFSALRTPNLVAPFLPFATFLGVVWTEVVHTQSGERMLVWNSGRSPLQCLTPVVFLATILGAGEFIMDSYLGPAAMAVQMHERLGLDGKRLDRTRRGEDHWIALSGGLLRTEIEYGPPPVLHNLTLYKRSAGGQLTELDVAAVAYQLPGKNLWLMRNGRFWTPEGSPASNDLTYSTVAPGMPRTTRWYRSPSAPSRWNSTHSGSASSGWNRSIFRCTSCDHSLGLIGAPSPKGSTAHASKCFTARSCFPARWPFWPRRSRCYFSPIARQ